MAKLTPVKDLGIEAIVGHDDFCNGGDGGKCTCGLKRRMKDIRQCIEENLDEACPLMKLTAPASYMKVVYDKIMNGTKI